ncbi:hypothetical protein D3C81_2300750 [compost metagenome]
MPIEKKSAWAAKERAWIAAAGTSIMMPTGTVGASSSSRMSSHRARKAISSWTEVIIGNMMERSAPAFAAR